MTKQNKLHWMTKLLLIVLINAIIVLVLMAYGDTGFSLTNTNVVWQIRFPKIVVAFMGGGLLACAGYLLQVFFQNPLAGTDLLGINSGASFGVAIAMMGLPFLPEELGMIGQTPFALLGALGVFFILLFLAQKNVSRTSLIITGILISSFLSSFISLMVNVSPSLQIKNFLMWSMGSFQALTLDQLPFFSLASAVLVLSLFTIPKSLNQFSLGQNYAQSMGLNIKRFKIKLILLCSLITSLVTVACGPIAFIGVISPFIARFYIKQSNSLYLLPIVFLTGSFIALISEFIIIFVSRYSFNTNSILGLIGAPLIAFYLYQSRKEI
jgi:iron complex transport system permease protein